MSRSAGLAALRDVLGDRLSYSKPEVAAHVPRIGGFDPVLPDAVAYPTSPEDVARIVQVCANHDLPVVCWGKGTSIEGQTMAVRGGVAVNFKRMNRLLRVQPDDQLAVVQPGLTRESLNRQLRGTGMFFSVDPGADATLGGMAATRASGTRTVGYGAMRQNVLATQAVLADGRMIRSGSQARKSASGYDLTALLVGSEGTLGVLTELTLRLHPEPETTAITVASFSRFADAVSTVMEAVQSGLRMARIELLDDQAVAACNSYGGSDLPVAPHLLVEFHGSPTVVREATNHFAEIAGDWNAQRTDWADTPVEREALWMLRYNAYYAITSQRPRCETTVTDICVPISRLAEALEETRDDMHQQGLSGGIVGHVGDGNFHAIVLADPGDTAERARVAAFAERTVARALRLSGTATGEHGVGMGKLGFMPAEHGAAWDVMGQIKSALDPQNILNPGKLVPPQELPGSIP